jgi:hypothetical protein
MPATVNVNKLTVVHSGSSGMAMSFPDVCKTPTPAGPIPIPYPNIAQSSDTADGSSTVKVDGNPIMLKSSNFSTSSGDEAGSAMGVVSSKNKGKASPVNASFDVKVDGKDVFRLTDPMQSNGSSANAMVPVEAQSPLPEGLLTTEECKNVKEKREEQTESVSSKNSGMRPKHFSKIKNVAKEFKVIFYFRQSEAVCGDWIDGFHQPKPHAVFLANTIKNDPALVAEVDNFLTQHKKDVEGGGKIPTDPKIGLFFHGDAAKIKAASLIPIRENANIKGENTAYSTRGRDFIGIIGEGCGVDDNGKTMRRPLQAIDLGPQLSGKNYKGKWITADYDLFHLIYAKEGCANVDQGSKDFNKLKRAINKGCQWDAIQHGPQTQWISNAEDVALGAPDSINFPADVKKGLADKNAKHEVPIKGRTKGMKAFDSNVTVIAPEGVVFLKDQQDTWDAMKCRECDKK